MQESVVFLVFAVAGTCGGIFWTNSKDNDYPRIGRRSFYTSSSENNYPRIGRRSFYTSSSENSYPRIGRRSFYTSSSENKYPRIGRSDGQNPLKVKKQGSFFTQSDENTFPRIGRSDFGKSINTGNDLGKNTGSVQDTTGSPFPSSAEEKPTNTNTGSTFSLPAPILFFAWDTNGDDSLSRDEFVNGIANSRKRRRLV